MRTGCFHYNSPQDNVAIKFKCCKSYYACFFCHLKFTTHLPLRWELNEFSTLAILCTQCGNEMTINQYFSCNYFCVHCKVPFNPQCKNHNHLYFENL